MDLFQLTNQILHAWEQAKKQILSPQAQRDISLKSVTTAGGREKVVMNETIEMKAHAIATAP